MIDLLEAGPTDAAATLLLAHGAGAGMDTRFLNEMAELLAERRVRTLRFEFAYMASRRRTGKRRPAPKAETLAGEYRAAVEAAEAQFGVPAGDRGENAGQVGIGSSTRLAIGGKSMGGRVASYIADALAGEGRITRLVCLGYPFHPPGTPEATRTAHLAKLACRTLIVQGERDPFGSRAEVEGYALSPAIAMAWIGDGDHDLGPRGSSGFTRKGNLAAAADAVAAFLLDGASTSP